MSFQLFSTATLHAIPAAPAIKAGPRYKRGKRVPDEGSSEDEEEIMKRCRAAAVTPETILGTSGIPTHRPSTEPITAPGDASAVPAGASTGAPPTAEAVKKKKKKKRAKKKKKKPAVGTAAVAGATGEVIPASSDLGMDATAGGVARAAGTPVSDAEDNAAESGAGSDRASSDESAG
eukprot:m.248346 g.248346  ORF g.248346 m.248346 type:complete len:177 (+) comp15704_c0_seq1:22-552(+)